MRALSRRDLAVIADASLRSRAARAAARARPATRVAAGAQALIEAAADPALRHRRRGDRRRGRARIDAGRRARRQAPAAGQQGSRRDGRAAAARRAATRAAASCCRSIPNTTRCSSACRAVAPGSTRAGVRRIVLTASGGPFRGRSARVARRDHAATGLRASELAMGRKISVDSATLMNKGLEVIEAHFLFDAPAERIEVVVHPQSIVHSMVEYADGSVLAQLGNPGHAHGARLRAGLARAHRCRRRAAGPRSRIARLDFEAPDLRRRSACLDLAYGALRARRQRADRSLNAANEEAVAAFLDGRAAVPRHRRKLIEATPSAMPARSRHDRRRFNCASGCSTYHRVGEGLTVAPHAVSALRRAVASGCPCQTNRGAA